MEGGGERERERERELGALSHWSCIHLEHSLRVGFRLDLIELLLLLLINAA